MKHVTTDRLIADLKTVVEDADELLRATAGQTGEKIAAARERAEDSLHAARERLGEMQKELIDQTRELAESADSYVRKNPWQAVGVAAAAGLVVGLLITRR